MKKQFLILSLIVLAPSLVAKLHDDPRIDILHQAMNINRISSDLLRVTIQVNSMMEFLNNKFNYNLSQEQQDEIDGVRAYQKSRHAELKKQLAELRKK